LALVVLAIGDHVLQQLCQAELMRAGHSPIVIMRPLEMAWLPNRVKPDLVLVDDSKLGREAARAAAGVALAGLGLQDPAFKESLSLPIAGHHVVDLVERVAGATAAPRDGLSLDPVRRVARANGREVDLTPIEFRLLEAAYARRGRELTPLEAVEAAWGPGERASAAVLRAHVRNLRHKLDQIGLPNALRSLRGRGYSLVL
jgi:hypothetical protein